MGENKGQTIFLSVIGIATLLVAIIGATFAYFTTTMNNEGGTTGSSVTTTKLTAATFTVEAGAAKTGLFPGDSFNDTKVIVDGTSANLTGEMKLPYICTVTLVNSATNPSGKAIANVEWAASKTGVTGTKAKLDDQHKTFTGELSATNLKDEWTITANVQETGGNQDNEQGATANLEVSCIAQAGDLQYTAGGQKYNKTGD